MDYTTSLLWLLCWPILIYITYKLIGYALKKFEATKEAS